MTVFVHHHSGGRERGDHVTAATYLKALGTLLFVTAVIAAGAGLVALAFSKLFVAVLSGVAS
jgi:hypothetical protein